MHNTLQLFALALSGGKAQQITKDEAYEYGWDLYEDWVLDTSYTWGTDQIQFLVYGRVMEGKLEIWLESNGFVDPLDFQAGVRVDG